MRLTEALLTVLAIIWIVLLICVGSILVVAGSCRD